MATLRARCDEDHAYFYAGDSFGIPADAFDLLRKRFSADWSRSVRELRISRKSSPLAIDRLEVLGHKVLLVRDGDESPSWPGGAPECAQCGHPYQLGTDPAGRACCECGADLVLVPPPDAA